MNKWQQQIISTRHMDAGAAGRIDAYYRWIGETKIDIHSGGGFDVDGDSLHPSLFPHQRDTVRWMLARGRALNASSFGLGKTRIACEALRQIHGRDGGRCFYCHCDVARFGAHFDHVLPVARGGQSTYANLVLSCARCNSSKSASVLENLDEILLEVNRRNREAFG